jgi:hypothetical protein
VCEYRGPVAAATEAFKLKSDKGLEITLGGETFTILGNNICAYLNDCGNVYDRVPILDSNGKEDTTIDFAPYDGYNYNVAFRSMYGKMFAVSLKEIKEGEELFVSYGR